MSKWNSSVNECDKLHLCFVLTESALEKKKLSAAQSILLPTVGSGFCSKSHVDHFILITFVRVNQEWVIISKRFTAVYFLDVCADTSECGGRMGKMRQR